MATKKKLKRNFLLALIFLFTFILPVTAVTVGIWLFKKTAPKLTPQETAGGLSPSLLVPSQILNNKGQYAGQSLEILGKVVTEPVVCEKKNCSLDDVCCGCPTARDLVLMDAGATILSQKSQDRLTLMPSQSQSFCQRKSGSCDYDCGDWQVDRIYEVNGKFVFEKPPPGWKKSLNFYFEVKNKRLASQHPAPKFSAEKFKLFISDFKALIGRLKNSGYYVID